MLLLSQITSLYILCPSTQCYNPCLVQLSFKSYRKKRGATNQKIYIDTDVYIYLCLSLPMFHLFRWIWITVHYPFISVWRTFFSISHMKGLLARTCLNFCSPRYVLTSSFLKTILPDIGSLLTFLFAAHWICHPTAF